MDFFENKYVLLLEDFKYWENRKFYLELMERFLNDRIDGRQFESEFCQMWRVDRDKAYSSEELFQKMKNVDVIKLKGFSTLISDLFTDCDVFEPNSALRDDFEISEEELKNCVKKTFLEIKNCYL